MAVRYYDEAIVSKLQGWIPENSSLRVLKPGETKRLFQLIADDSNDSNFKLPFISISRNNDVKLNMNTKTAKSFDGIRLISNDKQTLVLNAIPIDLNYQLDIWTKTVEEGDEYLREFIFKIINNPKIFIEVPYNGVIYRHIANIRLLDTVSDTSEITERLFSGEFTKWTLQLEILDAFLFNIPFRRNWQIVSGEVEIVDGTTNEIIEEEKIL